MLSGNSMYCKLLHPAKAAIPIFSSFLFKCTVLKFSQLSKQNSGISTKFSDNSTSVKFLHPENAAELILTTLLDIIIFEVQNNF